MPTERAAAGGRGTSAVHEPWVDAHQANALIWFSVTQRLEIYEQANARIVRRSRTTKTLAVHLSATAVQRAVFARLRNRGKMQGLLLDMFEPQELTF